MTKPSILVCGTGIAGLAAALGLARSGLASHKPNSSDGGYAIALLGPKVNVPPASPDIFHPRVYAVSSSSQAFLARLGVWDMLDASRVTAVEGMEIYGDGDGYVNLNAWQAAHTELAWIIESSEIERVLHQALRMFGVAWHAERFERLENHRVVTDTGRQLEADLLIGADGAQSAVRTAAGIHPESTAYGHMGLVAHLTAQLPHQNVAFQWFTGDTVLALLPMPDTADGPQVSMVWSMPEARAQALLAMSPPDQATELARRLTAATGGRLGTLQMRSAMFGFPLVLENSDMVAPGVALVGDAAHRVHPLAGQGLNLGLADVEELIRVLSTKETYRKPGDLRVLRRYRRARAESLLAMRIATHGLQRLFAVQAAPVVWARNIGMHCVDRLPFLKRRLIASASGH